MKKWRIITILLSVGAVACMAVAITKCNGRKNIGLQHSGDSILLKRAESFNRQGIHLQEQNDRQAALQCFEQTYNTIMQAHDRMKAVDACINCADVERQIGNVAQAAAWYRRAGKLADSLDYREAQNSILAGLGQIYNDLHNYRLSQAYFAKAERNYPPATPKDSYFFYNSRGNAYSAERRHEEAMTCFRKAQRAASQTGSDFAVAVVDANIGQTWLELGKADSAQKYLDSAAAYFFASPDRDDAIQFFLNGLYASLALLEKDYHKAHTYLSKPYNPTRMSPSYMYLHHRRMAEYCEKTGNYAEALRYLRLTDRYDDSLRNVTMLNAVAETNLRFRQDTAIINRDNRIMAAEEHATSARIISWLVIGILTLAIVLITCLWRYKSVRSQQQNAMQKRRIMELKMATVRNRFSPHFVFNVLNAFIPSVADGKGSELLFLLIRMLRNNLLTCDRTAVTLEEELAQVDNYARLRHSVNSMLPELVTDIASDVDIKTLIPSMMVQIPAENALKYAFNSMPDGETPTLVFKAALDGDTLHMTLTDNGCGFSQNSVTKERREPGAAIGTGTGLRILYSTIEMLNRGNSDKISFIMENLANTPDGGHGTRVTMRVPLKYKY